MTSIFDQFEQRESGFDKVGKASNSGAFPEYLERMATDLAAVRRSMHGRLQARPGQRILDVGCGTGVDVLAIAELVSPDGWAVGMDNSQVMVDAARGQAAERGLSAEFTVGDAHELAFPDDTFDTARTERVLQHVAERPASSASCSGSPSPAGGSWPPTSITACGRRTPPTARPHASGWPAGSTTAPTRGSPGRRRGCSAAGVEDIQVTVLPVAITDLEPADAMTGLGRTAKLIVAKGGITAE